MKLNPKSFNFINWTCFFNNGFSLVTSKDSFIKRLNLWDTYLGTFSLNLRKRLYKLVSKSLPQCNIKVIFQSKNRLSSFFKFKDSIPLHLHSHLIYKFQCSNCNITYYGKIERHLKVKACEHISTSPLTEKRVNNNKKSSFKDHCLLSGHGWSKNLY